MNAQDRGEWPVASLRPGYVQLQMLSIRVCVFDVTLKCDAIRHNYLGRLLRDENMGGEQGGNCRKARAHGGVSVWCSAPAKVRRPVDRNWTSARQGQIGRAAWREG